MVDRKEGGKRKRMVEEYDVMEQATEPPRTKTKPNTTNGRRAPVEKMIPGGIFVLGGAKSITEKEPTTELLMGALNSGLIEEGLMERRKEVSRGNLTEGLDFS